MRTGLLTSRTLLLLTLLLSGIAPSFAYLAGTAIDPGFGSGGIAAVPPYDASYVVSDIFGFVHLPISGGYLVFTKQTKAGVEHVVATRFTDAGVLDTGWGVGGQQTYAVPTPTGTDARVVVAVEGGAERIYLVGRFVSGTPYLMVATFGANGAFQNFSSSDVHTSFQNDGVGEVLAVEAGATTVGQGLLIAVKGASSSSATVALVGAIYTNNLPGQIYPGSTTVPRASFRINGMQDRGDGKVDILGTEGSQAVYMRFDPHNFTVETEKFFNFPCQTGFATSSVADGMVHPASFGGDVLVGGRVACSSGDAYSIAARVASIDLAPAVAWGTRLEGVINPSLAFGNCQQPFYAAGCSTANIAYSTSTEAGEAFFGSTYPAVIHLDLGTAPAGLTGADFTLANQVVLPSAKYGSHYQYPYLVGVAANGAQLGLGRVAVDRIFADRVDATP